MSKRLNDTAAITNRLGREVSSVSIRPVENGHMICTSSDGPSGYSYKETFSKERPTISVAQPKAGESAGSNSMSRAVAHAKR